MEQTTVDQANLRNRDKSQMKSLSRFYLKYLRCSFSSRLRKSVQNHSQFCPVDGRSNRKTLHFDASRVLARASPGEY
jgi:hypothetical protein